MVPMIMMTLRMICTSLNNTMLTKMTIRIIISMAMPILRDTYTTLMILTKHHDYNGNENNDDDDDIVSAHEYILKHRSSFFQIKLINY